MAVQTRSWFPGRVIPLARLARLEVLPVRAHSIQVQVGRDTVFGTPAQALETGLALVRAAADADPVLASKVTERHLLAALGN